MIEGLDLHDATLRSVDLAWADGRCVMTIRHSRLADCTLTFSDVSNLILPRARPWGPSQSINCASTLAEGRYEIEMQSGDRINITARAVVLAPLANAG